MEKTFMTVLASLSCLVASQAQDISFLSNNHCLYRIEEANQGKKYLLLPVQESAEMANIKVIVNQAEKQAINVRLAYNRIDYYVPLDLADFGGMEGLMLDIHVNGTYRQEGELRGFACWKDIKFADTFSLTNREQHRPVYHHTPAYGWMNDPNGMFYKDGVWHLYFQHNPYGSQWENMTWGHSTSTDLVHWTYEGDAIRPDALGTVFSGSAVVDKDNTAGFGEGAIVAMYTSAGENQTQSLAVSTDNGKTFAKYKGNPVVTSNVPDFRDPHMLWNEEIGKWNLILAAGQQMNIYTSSDLKTWNYESSFGLGYGNHDGVWECPDLMKLKVSGTDKEKWMLVCNINPGGPFGGSATQYFIGTFDGHKFTCESAPEVTKWMDYGKDHYATVTFDNAPDGRHVALAWMSNWQYANQVPTRQYRSANSIPRDLGLFEYNGETYCSSTPSAEITSARSEKAGKELSQACEVVVDLKGTTTIVLSNDRGEQVSMTYNAEAETFEMDRTQSGQTDFSNEFPATTKAPTYGKINQLRIFIDKSSIEAIDADGKMAMTNIVFPGTPYNKITLTTAGKKLRKAAGKYVVYQIK